MPTSLVSDSPLFAPVQYKDQTYFTSQYFHREYVTNSHYVGKYARHHNFARLMRSIPAYAVYVRHGDIAELSWRDISEEANPNLICLRTLFQAVGFQRLTLLNATAQLALSHHLDDVVSQQMSVAANTQVARQQFSPEDADLLVISKMTQAIAATRQEVRRLSEQTDKNTRAIARIEAQEERKTIEEYVVGNRLQRRSEERRVGKECRL